MNLLDEPFKEQYKSGRVHKVKREKFQGKAVFQMDIKKESYIKGKKMSLRLLFSNLDGITHIIRIEDWHYDNK